MQLLVLLFSKEIPTLNKKQFDKLIMSVADALIHLHEKQIIHRDIKPNNIMALPGKGKSWEAVIIDFNACSLASSDAQLKETIFGTAGYAAPEIW